MMSETFTIGSYKVRVTVDEEALDPREDFDNAGMMACWHSRYNLGDEQPKCSPEDYLLRMMQDRELNLHGKWVPDEVKEQDLKAYIEKHFLVLPLYLYDHSGLSMQVTPFQCLFDSGKVGFIYVDRESKAYDNLREGLIAEVQVYSQYLQGDVWQYVIEDSSGNVVNSCCGFYGFDACVSEARHIASGYVDQPVLCA